MKAKLIFLSVIYSFGIYAQERYLVTGGAGFIGGHVVEKLLEQHKEVIIIDSFNNYYDPQIKRNNVSHIKKRNPIKSPIIYEMDLCNYELLEKIFEKEQPTIICHLAAYAGVGYSVKNPRLYIRNNLIGLQNLLDLAQKYKIKNFVFSSSSSVYGKNSEIPFVETQIADKPCSPYAATKRAGELLAYTYYYLYKLPCTCLRFFTVYGPRGRPDMAPFKFIDLISKGEPIYQFGEGTRMRDFTYIDDIVDGIICSLHKPLGFEIINLGRGEPISLQDFIATIERVIGKKAHIIKKPVPAGDVDITYANISKAKKLLGYEPKVSLLEGIQKMYEWYKTNYFQ